MFSPEIAALARTTRAKIRKRLPGAIEMVYDNFNALVIGYSPIYSPTQRPSDATLSIVLYPRWVNVCSLHGAPGDFQKTTPAPLITLPRSPASSAFLDRTRTRWYKRWR